MRPDQSIRRPSFFTLAVILSLAFLPAAVSADIDIEEARELPWMSLDKLLFFVDVAAFPTDSTLSRTEFYIGFPGNELNYVDSLSGGAEIRYQLKLKNQRGKKIFEEKKEISIPPADRDSGGYSPGHVILVSKELPPGWYELEIKIEDRLTQKIGLAYMGRKSHKDGKVKGIFQIPAFDADKFEVSQLEAAWGIYPREGLTKFSRGSVDVFPNPSRTYGLYQKQASVYYEIRSPDETERVVEIATRIQDLDGNVLREGKPTQIVVAGRSWSQAIFDVSALLSGAYDLVVSVRTDDETVLERTLRFNVGWALHTWAGDPRARVDEVHFLVDDRDREEAFMRLTRGEQEHYLEEYWRTRDPDPTTGRNEEQERFYERVAYANRNWGTTGVERGMFTDMGRIYIRYGPPDEVLDESMPTNGLQVSDIASQIAESDGIEYAAPLQGRGNIGSDMRAYQIWYYDRLSSGSSEESQDSGSRRPMRRLYIFVDEEGYGMYVLRYSND